MEDLKRRFFLGLLLFCSLSSYPVRAQDNLKPFVVDHRKAILSHSPVDMSFLLDAPAGKHGFITVKGGHLATADGQRIRLWGVNLSDMGNSSLPHGWIPGSAATILTKEDAPVPRKNSIRPTFREVLTVRSELVPTNRAWPESVENEGRLHFGEAQPFFVQMEFWRGTTTQ